MARTVADENDLIYGNALAVAGHGLAVTGPLVLGLAVVGLVALARDPRWRDLRFVGVAFGVLFVAVAVSSGRHYYMIPMYPVLVAIGAVALHDRREAGRTRPAWPIVALSAVLAGVAAASSTLLSSPAFADTMIATTARIHRELPPEERARTALVASPYVYAADLDAAPADLPPAASPNRAYGWFPPPPGHQDRMLLVGDPTRLRPFATMRPVATAAATTPLGTYGGLVPEATTAWVLEGRTASWSPIWSRLRDLTVVAG